MTAGADALAAEVRHKRDAIEDDLQSLRVGVRRIDPRRRPEWWLRRAVPAAIALLTLMVWRVQRHRARHAWAQS